MAQKSKPRTPRKSSYRGFEGVDLKKTHSGDESIALIQNFRITDDGSLKKRCGYKTVYEGDETFGDVKTSYSRTENGTEVCYFIQGNFVKKYNSKTQTVTSVGELEESDYTAFFFEYLDKFFVCNGLNIQEITADKLSEALFYIPLYGKDWASFAGEQNEPLNLLWNKLAISYKIVPPATSYLPLGDIKISTIDALYRNGVLLSNDQYSISEMYNAISVIDFKEDDVFLAIVSFTGDEYYEKQKRALFDSCYTSLFYELNKNNIFFWGSKDHNKVFYSADPNTENMKITKTHSRSGKFYIPVDSYFSISSDNDRIKAFIRHYDRVLIMTESSTWITNLQDLESNSLKIKNINSSIGCTLTNGCVRIENTLFSVGSDAIYAWSADTDELNECNAYSISDPIKPLLDTDFFKKCSIHLHYAEREIWFYSSNSTLIWIYNYKRKAWYCFNGLAPQVFLDGGSTPRFFKEYSLCIFDDSLRSDICKRTEAEIVGTLKSGELEFNSKHKKKLYSATVRGSISGGSLKLNIILDSQKRLSYDVSPNSFHSVIPFRAKSGSFSSMTFELTAKGKGEQIIHGIELDAD